MITLKDILCLGCVLLHCMVVTGSLHHSSSHSSNSFSASHSSSPGSSISRSSSCQNCHCDEYNKIISYRNSHDCTDENKLFPLLKALDDKSHYCRKKAIDYMAGKFSSMSDTPSRCQCSGHNNFHDYRQGGGDIPFSCFPDRNFDMWSDLSKVSSRESYSTSCQQLLVQHLAAVFKDSDTCSCSKAVHTHPPSTTTTRSTPSTTTTTVTTKPIVTSTVAQVPVQQHISVKFKCGKLSTVESIAIQHHVDQKNATLCATGNRQGSDESFVLINCDAPDPSEWKQGVNVMQHCKNIPTYTPVATFIGGSYYPSLAESGVFMGCIDNGFKLGIQHCNSIPTIDHVLTSSTGLQNADVFFTIE